MHLQEDFFTDIVENPGEKDAKKLTITGEDGKLLLTGEAKKRYTKLRSLVLKGDAIKPAIPEAPFNEGAEGFVSPHEWHFDYMDGK